MKNPVKISIFLVITLVLMAFFIKPSENQVRSKMEKALLKEYGEEFVVENIGLRDANGDLFYEARIYPKSIIGTPKEEDKYYYGSASIEVNVLGILSRGTGDDYSYIHRNDDVENYLIPKAKEIFGDKIRLKVDVEHEKTGDGSWWGSYKSSSLKEMREDIEKNPKKARVVLELKIFVFDKIDNKEEEEARKKQLFEFLQYLRKEKLDKYLSVDCDFMDDIVLAPSFEENRYTLEDSKDKEEKREIENKLREEVKKLSEKEFLDNMNGILKSEFDYTNNGSTSILYRIGIMQILSTNYIKEVKPERYSYMLEEDIKKYNYKNFKNTKDYIFYKEDN